MVRTNIKIAWRNLITHKGHSLISITGLGIGLAFAIAIALFVDHETSYESFDGAEDVYRANVYLKDGEKVSKLASSAPTLAAAVRSDVPGVIAAVRFRSGDPMLFQADNRQFYESLFLYADPSLFDVFPFRLIEGDPGTALIEPFSVVLTQKTAKKYFGEEPAVGKVLRMDNLHSVKVTGVIAPTGYPSHLDGDLFLSFKTYEALQPQSDFQNWGWVSFFTYFRFQPGSDPTELERQIRQMTAKYVSKEYGQRVAYHLQPLRDIYLKSEGLLGYIGPLGNRSHVITLTIIGGLILLISAFNFTNLALARAGQRSKEIGVRKVLGSDRRHLVGQFLSESVMVSVFALILALGTLEILGPQLFAWMNFDVDMTVKERARVGFVFIGVALSVGLMAGLYPALFMSGFKVVSVLKGQYKTGSAGSNFRKVLVVFQFAASVLLIVGTIVVFRQMEYTLSKDLGFRQEQVVVLPMRGAQLMQKYGPLKEALLRDPGVVSVASSRNGLEGNYGSYDVRGNTGEPVRLMLYPVNHDFFETLNIAFAEGRSFSKDFPSDEREGIILNETAVRKLGWKDPLGKRLPLPHIRGVEGTVVGVARDFHFTSLHEEIGPLLLFLMPHRNDNVFIRLREGPLSERLDAVEEIWHRMIPEFPFEFVFLDQRIHGLYQRDRQFSRATVAFSIAAIAIACMGLLGLASFAAQQRTKEIGIRKVLGASVANILSLVSREFIILVMVANAVAWPVGYFAMSEWLKDFAYRIELDVLPFLSATAITMAIAMFTVLSQAYRTSTANPVKALKYE